MRFKILLLTVITGFLLTALSCQRTSPPSKPPPLRKVEYTGPAEGFPPKVKDRTNVRTLRANETRVLTREMVAELDAIARNDATVRTQLGERAGLLHYYYFITKKEPSKPFIKLIYYSYSNLLPFEIDFDEKTIIKKEAMRDFKPAATTDEIKRAVSIALSNPEIKSATRNLSGRGILSYKKFDSAEIANHRIIFVGFSPAAGETVEYYAYVDLIRDSVIEHGKSVTRATTDDFKAKYLRRR